MYREIARDARCCTASRPARGASRDLQYVVDGIRADTIDGRATSHS
jgi:hypothetical protein